MGGFLSPSELLLLQLPQLPLLARTLLEELLQSELAFSALSGCWVMRSAEQREQS